MRRPQVFSELNMVPYLDVMLVLLIIFMVAAPWKQSEGLTVHLPSAQSEAVAVDESWVQFTLDRHGRLHATKGEVNEALPHPGAVVSWLQKHKITANQVIAIQADKKVSWELVAQLIAQTHRGGWQKVVFLTESQAT